MKLQQNSRSDKSIQPATDPDSGFQAPPASNRGAQNTFQPPLEKEVSIDWLEFTAPADWVVNDKFKSLKTYLKIPKGIFTDVPRGMQGYPCQKMYGVLDDQVKILYGATSDMGVHVIISGGCLRRATGDIHSFIHWLLHHKHKITRLDIAIDDHSKTITPEKIHRYLQNGLALSPFKSFRFIESGTISGKMARSIGLGKTLYLGSPHSRTMIRIYDKGLEQIAEYRKLGRPCSPIRPWCRIELQFRGDNAQNYAEKMHEKKFRNLGSIASSVLAKYLKIVKKNSKKDSNKSRWPLANFWAEFLGAVEKISISTPKLPFDLPRTINWFKRQVSPSFSAVLDVLGPEQMMDIYKLGKARLTGDKKLIVDFERRERQSKNAWCYAI